jgi:deazaflavin-dependent oxidoreductase (nitroreductase family)
VGRVPAVQPEASFPLKELLTRFAMSRPGRWFAIHVAARVDPQLGRLTRGRLTSFLTAPVVLLTVRGARTGRERTCPLLYYTEGDDVIVIASSFGRERHPAWYHNLRATSEATLTSRGRSGRYRPREVTDEDERLRLYRRAESLYRGWRDYEVRAGSFGRRIAVFRLSPV